MGIIKVMAALAAMVAAVPAGAQQGMVPVRDRAPGEGEGPYPTLVIRGATLIDGTGAPPRGPVDIVVEGNRIAAIRSAGTPGVPLRPNREPRGATREIDATGQYVMPGFIDTHGHNGDPDKAPDPSYGYKLWLAHGVTSVRGVSFSFGPGDRSLVDAQRSAASRITAPRLFPYVVVGDGWGGGRVDTAEQGRAWTRWAAKSGYHGVKLFLDQPPAVTAAVLDEARKVKLGTVAHLRQTGVSEINARRAGELGLGTVTHFYGHFESLLKGRALPDYPPGYNFNDEQDRFFEFTRIIDSIHEPGGPEWNAYLREQLDRDVTFNPTFNIYSASRDLMRAKNADWHAQYTLPSLTRFFAPSLEAHGSYWFDWTSSKEVAWRRFYGPYMRLINDYKNMGGRVTLGSDPGYIYQTWGFSYIGEMEMLEEAGFSPLEVIRAATMHGAEELYKPKGQEAPFGIVRVGKLADLVITPENPLQNLKTLYGTGFERLGPDGKVRRVGGVRYTIKDGVVYDAKVLLADVARMVVEQKAREAASAGQPARE